MTRRRSKWLFLRFAVAASCLFALGCEVAVDETESSGELLGAQQASSPPTPELLTHGASFTGSLPGSKARDEFVVDLSAGEALQVRIDQQDLDVVAELFEERGHQLLIFDSPTGDSGPERVCYVAAASGRYRLTVWPWKPSLKGRYQLYVEDIHPATLADKSCWNAAQATVSAEALWEERGASRELIRRYEEAISLWRRSGWVYQEALAWQRLGRLHSLLGDVPAEAHCFEQAQGLFRAAGSVRQEVQVFANLSRTYALQGDFDKAQDAAQQALAAAHRAGDPFSEAAARNALAVLQISRGQAHLALQELKRVQALWQSEGRPESQAEALYRLGITYAEELGRFSEAIDVLEQALDIWREAGRREDQAAALIIIGWARYRAGDPEEATHLYEQALEISRAVGSQATTVSALDRMGTAFVELGRYGEAFKVYREALELSEAAGNRLNEAHTRGNLGWLLYKTGRYLEARAELEESLELLHSLGDRDAVAHVLVGVAATERSLGNPSAARRRFEEAFQVLDSLRNSALRQGGRLPPDPLWQDYSERYIDLLMDLADEAEGGEAAARAFETAELARARNLYEILLEADIDLRADADPALLERERELLSRFDAIEWRRREFEADQAADMANDSLARQQRALVLDLERLQEEIRASSPHFAEIWNPRPVGLAQIQALLAPDTQLLSFVLGERRSFLFVLGADGLKHHTLPPRRNLEKRARAAYFGLASPQLRTQGQARRAAGALAEALFPPLASLPAASRLVVVTDGALSYIPFAALPLPGSAEGQFVDAYEIVQLPSAAVLVVLAHRGTSVSPAVKELAVLADPIFSPQDRRIESPAGGSAVEVPSAEFDRLPYTTQEAEAILSLVDPQRRLGALGFDASKELVTGGGLRGYRLVHFATHAVIDEEQPGRSRIVLSQFDCRGEPIPGDLRLAEIYTLDLPAEMVVLSACQTALGREVRGNGLVGLTRGFFYAGAQRLVVSLWDVDDQATAALMVAFYRSLLEEKLSPAAALRQAQVEVRSHQHWAAPYYWAGFVLQGPGR